jgi:hypothetical protein
VSSDGWNLVAASLCTLGTAVGTVALMLSAPTSVSLLASLGGGIATVGGVDHRGGNCSKEAAMTRHDYLVLGMVAIWLVTNFLGFAFTIRRLKSRQSQQPPHHSKTAITSSW